MVRPKKFLGQHFLKDENIARNIVDAMMEVHCGDILIELGPGTGVLTNYLQQHDLNLLLVELDRESVAHLKKRWPQLTETLLNQDFLTLNISAHCNSRCSIIGNFPYNISSQIFFKILENKHLVHHVVGMVQREVGERIASPPGSKRYGILSVLLQAYYQVEYLFSVAAESFHPPPKVESGVLRLSRNETEVLACDEKLFFRVVKQAFQNRRKTLRNALKPLNLPEEIQRQDLLSLRAEQLSVNDFVTLTSQIERH